MNYSFQSGRTETDTHCNNYWQQSGLYTHWSLSGRHVYDTRRVHSFIWSCTTRVRGRATRGFCFFLNSDKPPDKNNVCVWVMSKRYAQTGGVGLRNRKLKNIINSSPVLVLYARMYCISFRIPIVIAHCD